MREHFSHIAADLRALAVPIGDIEPDPRNARTHSQQNVAAIAASLKAFGQRRPLVVNRRNRQIEAGHGLLEAAKSLGWAELAVVWVDDDPHGQSGFSIADNRTAELAEWDNDRLALLLADLREDDQFDELSCAILLGDLTKDHHGGTESTEAPEPQLDRAAELEKKWKTKPGQVWEIPGKAGVHRLLCGDARSLLPEIQPCSVDFIFTDPPYGHDNNNDDLIARREMALGKGKAGKPRPIANDGDEANELVRTMFREAARILKPGGCCCCCCCGGGGPDPQFARWSLWIDEAIGFKMCVVWDKGGLGMGWHYRRCWECVLVAQKPGAACNWHGGKDVPNIIREIAKIIPSKDQHPTEKPPQLAAWFLRLHSAEKQTVLDPFLGSGTTMVAAEQLGRVCYGIEIEPKYVAVALQRLADMGLKPRMKDEG